MYYNFSDNMSVCCSYSGGHTHSYNKELKHEGIFEQRDANQRWGLFPFDTLYASTLINASKILTASESLFSYRDNLLENLRKLHVLPKNARSPRPVNPLRPRSDQHQISPGNINVL